ncbi:hypothetical protein GCM10022243_68290 [Saccharothrix violaceirubra]|uniref:Uncharacterized protein n=1 Tax=Saccharothrix violaceirubra TaxID=413306 RepID=A0A7W7WXC0_9PSEU|nr:hypothetical protein [Saccharothrix violaceirubra]MBB4967235.1 hypothetical protein [Saccharothrix violaceirubra]
MTRIVRADHGITVGTPPPHPERTALLEARGAVLTWDVLTGEPSLVVHDPVAADWLWEVVGLDAADAILGAAAEVDLVPGPLHERARTAAHLDWVGAWWPASPTAGIAGVNPALLRAERAVAVNAVEHLLDDEDATGRALRGIPPLDTAGCRLSVDDLARQVLALAEDYGVEQAAAVPTRADFALAAGGDPSTGVTVLSGVSETDWSTVPRGLLDATAPARWSVVREGGTSYLEVAVPSGPTPGPVPLARFGPVEVPLERGALGWYTGRAAVAPTVLLLPPDRRVLSVSVPGYTAAPEDSGRRAAIVAYARARMVLPSATLTEREAGLR